MCAPLLGQKLLGLDLDLTKIFKEALFDGHELLRVGFTRINFSYFLHDEDIKYILDAIEFIAEYGWMLLPDY
jgi:selenocysteine lyase/cysteine desulfurase